MVKNKINLTPLLVSLLALVVYCICMFVLPLNRDGSFWSAFSFTVVSIALNAGIGIYIFRGDVSRDSKFLKAPILYVSGGYAVAQLLWGVLVVAFPITPIIAVIVSMILLGCCLALMISLPTSEAVVTKAEQHISHKTAYLKDLQLKLAQILPKCTNDTLKKAVKTLSEAIRYSDPISDDSLAGIEAEIAGQISALGSLVGKPEEALSVCEAIGQKLRERNERVKLLK